MVTRSVIVNDNSPPEISVKVASCLLVFSPARMLTRISYTVQYVYILKNPKKNLLKTGAKSISGCRLARRIGCAVRFRGKDDRVQVLT